MITKWRLFNFKSVRNQTELTFKPLTIFAGANSSGKSTVLQSILLVSQTTGSMVPSRSVVLNGHLTKLGQFDDLIQKGSESQQIAVGWECTPLRDPDMETGRPPRGLLAEQMDYLTSVSIDFAFDAVSAGGLADMAQLQPPFYGLSLTCVTRAEDGTDTVSTINVSRRTENEFLELRNRLSQEFGGAEVLQIPPGLEYRLEMDAETEDTLRRSEIPFEMQGCRMRHFLPDKILGIIHEDEVYVNLIVRALKGEALPRRHTSRLFEAMEASIPPEVIALLKERFQNKPHPALADHPRMRPRTPTEAGAPDSISLRDCVQRMRHVSPPERERIRAMIQELERDISAIVSGKSSHRTGWLTVGLPQSVRQAAEYTSHWFASGIQYLGPLRDEPKPLYPLAANVDPLDIGLSGEHTAAVLHLHSDRPVEYLAAENFKQPAIILQRARRSLKFAVLDWLKYMGVATDIETIDKGKLGHELKVRLSENDKTHDLTHVGVGVSQVLPIIVSCLLADRDTTLIFEQPELHLHPKVQTLLGDFFLAMSLLGKQCILETHSEYLINRLRFRAASAAKDSLSSIVQLYFVEKENGASNFREVMINQYGAILDWPDGFFDQSQSEAEEILRAATLKKRSEKEPIANDKRNT